MDCQSAELCWAQSKQKLAQSRFNSHVISSYLPLSRFTISKQSRVAVTTNAPNKPSRPAGLMKICCSVYSRKNSKQQNNQLLFSGLTHISTEGKDFNWKTEQSDVAQVMSERRREGFHRAAHAAGSQTGWFCLIKHSPFRTDKTKNLRSHHESTKISQHNQAAMVSCGGHNRRLDEASLHGSKEVKREEASVRLVTVWAVDQIWLVFPWESRGLNSHQTPPTVYVAVIAGLRTAFLAPLAGLLTVAMLHSDNTNNNIT